MRRVIIVKIIASLVSAIIVFVAGYAFSVPFFVYDLREGSQSTTLILENAWFKPASRTRFDLAFEKNVQGTGKTSHRYWTTGVPAVLRKSTTEGEGAVVICFDDRAELSDFEYDEVLEMEFLSEDGMSNKVLNKEFTLCREIQAVVVNRDHLTRIGVGIIVFFLLLIVIITLFYPVKDRKKQPEEEA